MKLPPPASVKTEGQTPYSSERPVRASFEPHPSRIRAAFELHSNVVRMYSNGIRVCRCVFEYCSNVVRTRLESYLDVCILFELYSNLLIYNNACKYVGKTICL